MTNNLRGKIHDFLTSEEGKVGVKTPLTLGVATGSVLLANAIVATTPTIAPIALQKPVDLTVSNKSMLID